MSEVESGTFSFEVLQAVWSTPSGPDASRKLVLEEIASLPLQGNVPQVPRGKR